MHLCVFVRSKRSDVINLRSPNNEVTQITKAPLSNYEATLRVKMIYRGLANEFHFP